MSRAAPGGMAIVLAVLLAASPALDARDFDPRVPWPLCGRISENPPAGWRAEDGCPETRFGRTAFSDEPLSSTFGPRPLYSGGNRYDFHRGLDIATPVGTPFFAIADGLVRIAGPDPSYSDPLVSLRHNRPGTTDCQPGGCYHSLYLHVDSWVVSAGETVEKGQLLGYTGESASGFAHLHFEVRNAPRIDPYSAWSRDAIHPLRLLPYTAPREAHIRFDRVDTANPAAVLLEFTLLSPRYDLLALDVEVLDRRGRPVQQPGWTPDERGYHVNPPFFDLEMANFMYSHKNSTAFPWESFGAGGSNECPYHADHGPSYSPHVHLDAPHPEDPYRGRFNGRTVRTLRYWPSDEGDYEVGIEFSALQGEAACLEVRARWADGSSNAAAWGDCPAGPLPAGGLRLTPAGNGHKVRLNWPATPGGRTVIYRDGRELARGVRGKSWTDHDVRPGERHAYRVCPGDSGKRCLHGESLLLPR